MAGGQLHIEQMYAFVVLDPTDNTEGIPAFYGGDGMALPMVGADMAMVDRLKPMARDMADLLGAKVTLVRFEVRTELETFEPGEDRRADG